MANARLEWTPLGGSGQSYTLPVNFTWNYQELAQDETDRERAVAKWPVRRSSAVRRDPIYPAPPVIRIWRSVTAGPPLSIEP